MCCLLKKKSLIIFRQFFLLFCEFSHWREIVCNLNWKCRLKTRTTRNSTRISFFFIVYLLLQCKLQGKKTTEINLNHISNLVGLCQNMSVIRFIASKWATSFDDAGQTNPKSIDWLYVTHMLVVFVFWLSFLFYFPFAFTSKTKSIFKNYELLTIHRNPLSLSAYEKFKLNHRFLVKSNAY